LVLLWAAHLLSRRAAADRRLNPATRHFWRRGELLVEVPRGTSRRFEMNPMLMAYFSVGMSFAGLGLLKLQARLEQWAYERHAED
jgi:hypothetical protein